MENAVLVEVTDNLQNLPKELELVLFWSSFQIMGHTFWIVLATQNMLNSKTSLHSAQVNSEHLVHRHHTRKLSKFLVEIISVLKFFLVRGNDKRTIPQNRVHCIKTLCKWSFWYITSYSVFTHNKLIHKNISVEIFLTRYINL